ncbi:MAG: hypothetical protein IPM48_04830 [Saprospiraceae bacterium]|nr:hypothetical protein [Saprospiraceae bacterium]
MIPFPEIENGYTISPEHTAIEALEKMELHDVKDLVLVEGKFYKGYFTKELLLKYDHPTKLRNIQMLTAKPCDYQGGFADFWLFYCENMTEQIPFVNHREEFLGVLHTKDLLNWYLNNLSSPRATQILILKRNKESLSLQEMIAGFVDMDIVEVMRSTSGQSGNEYITFLLKAEWNPEYLEEPVSENYQILKSFTSKENGELWNQKLEEFMHYLNV